MSELEGHLETIKFNNLVFCKQGNKRLNRWSDVPNVTWLVNVRTGNRISFPVFQPSSAISLHYLLHSINWLENKRVMSPKSFSPWAQRIFNGGKMCPHLWWETTQPQWNYWAMVHCFCKGILYREGREDEEGESPALPVLKTFSFPIRLCLFAEHEPSKLRTPNSPTRLPWFLSAAFDICYLSSGCQAGWIDLSWVLVVKAGLGPKHPTCSVIPWCQVSTCLICLQTRSPQHTTWRQ